MSGSNLRNFINYVVILSFVLSFIEFTHGHDNFLSSFNESQTSSTFTSALSFKERIEIEQKTFHFLPYKRIYHSFLPNGEIVDETACPPPRPPAIDDFPPGFWTRQQRLYGRFLVHIFVAVYCFIMIAFICDKYFLPTVERICEVLDISPDIAATTFMATATTIPEFFTNVISTFLTETDMGLSAIIGSVLFNTLGVAACAALFIKKPIQIDWWPVTRDASLLILNLSMLIVFAWDGAIMWWEASILVSVLVFYWIFMFNNVKIMGFVKGIVEDRLFWCQRIKNYDIENQCPKVVVTVQNTPRISVTTPEGNENLAFKGSTLTLDPNPAPASRRGSFYKGVQDVQDVSVKDFPAITSDGKKSMFWFLFTWPIRFLLWITIPHPNKHPKLFPLSFIMCIVWIAATSWVVFWMVVIIGDTFRIPDPVMALTFLAFGGCMPEAISAVIVARKGSGQMGVSNALGSNCLSILFSLSLPWFIRTMADGAGFTGAYIRIYSYGAEYILISIIFAVITLYIVISSLGYKLRRLGGSILSVSYIVFATFAILVELGIFFAPSDC